MQEPEPTLLVDPAMLADDDSDYEYEYHGSETEVRYSLSSDPRLSRLFVSPGCILM